MKVIAKCKCTKCNEVFEVNNNEYTTCPNNCCSISVGDTGEGVKYSNGMTNCYEIIERKVFRDPEDYIIPDEKCREIINFLISQEKEVDYYLRIDEDKCESGKKYLRDIYVSITSGDDIEMNYFSSNIYFLNYGRKNKLEYVYNKLLRLQKFISDVKNKKIDISVNNRDELGDIFECEYEQKELYDCRFNIDSELED